MSRLMRAAGAARRFVVRLMPTGRRDWVEALWTEADEAPPGWQRLAWRAGGVRLVARESVTRRRARRMLLFAEAAALMARAIGAGSGVLFGAVMYSVTPLGVNKYATNPWLPGSDVDPLVVLAWVLLLGGPVAAALLAGRRYPGPVSSGPPTKTKVGQGFVAGLLANLSGALIVTVLGMGTVALMLHATWLRTLFDHGHHLNAVVVYSHEIDAATNAQGYLLICVAFPVIGLFMSMMGAASVPGNSSAAGQGGPPRGGGPGQPGPPPGQPGGGRRPEAAPDAARLTASPFPDPRPADGEDRGDLVGAVAGAL